MPLVFPGASLPVVAVDESGVRPGDVVVVERAGALVTHRAIRRGADGRWITRGDASPVDDTAVDGERILAKVAGFALGRGVVDLPGPLDAFLRHQLAERGVHLTRAYLRGSRLLARGRIGVAEVLRLVRAERR